MENIPIKITERAAEEIKKIIAHKNIPTNYMLRVGVKGGGCGGATFFLAFDTPKAQDTIYQTAFGFPCTLQKGHLLYLLDVMIDYEERRDEQGFLFRKPAR